MAKEPWQEDIYDQEETRTERSKRKQCGGVIANRILTILASIFFVIVVVMIIVLIYLSSGGSNRTAALKDFHDSDANVEQVSFSSVTQNESSSSEEKAEETSSSSEHPTDPEGTTKVLAGEGEAAIAARAGISIAQLEALNPSHMATGSWFANPGDVIKIK